VKNPYSITYSGSDGSWVPVLYSLANWLSASFPERASLAQWLFLERTAGLEDYYWTNTSPLFILLSNLEVKPKSPAELNLPLTHFFQGQGWISMRSSWTDPDATFVGFCSRTYASGRMGGYSNYFTIWKNRGPLFWIRGMETSSHGFSGETWARNTLVLNGNQGQKKAKHGANVYYYLKDFPDNGVRIGGVKRFESRAGIYEYILGEVENNAYNGAIEKFSRHFVYLHGAEYNRPDLFVILDRIRDAGEVDEKHLVFQSQYEPELRRESWESGIVSGRKISGGKWLCEGVRYITVRNDVEGFNNAHGKAYLKILHPAQTKVYKVGGPGHQFNDWEGRDPRKQRPKSGRLTAEQKFFQGEWRMHITSAQSSEEEIFLFTIEATSSDDNQPVVMEKIEGGESIGAVIGNWIVLFSKRDSFLSNSTLNFQGEGEYNLLICDLVPHRPYRVRIGNKQFVDNASSESTIFLSGVNLSGEVKIELAALSIEGEKLKEEMAILSYPNPFNPECYIPVNVKSKMQDVKCKIYNILGQLVREIECSRVQEFKGATVYWDGRDSRGLEVPSGMYFYEITGEGVRRMVVLK
jgi:hypothetical protein